MSRNRIIPTVTDDISNTDALIDINNHQSWLEEDERSSDDLLNLLSQLNSKKWREHLLLPSKMTVTRDWIKSTRNKISFEDLKHVLDKDGWSDINKVTIIKSWINKRGVTKDEIDQALTLFTDNSQKKYHNEILLIWLETGESRTVDELKGFLPKLSSKFDTSRISENWLEKGLRSADEFTKIFPYAHSRFTRIPYLDIVGLIRRPLLPYSWLNRGERTTDDLLKVLPLTDRFLSERFALSWLQKEGRSAEDLRRILPTISHHNERYEDLYVNIQLAKIIKPWLLERDIKGKERNAESLSKALPVYSISLRIAAAKSWFTEIRRPRNGYDDFITLLKDIPLNQTIYTARTIATLYMSNNTQFPSNKFTTLCQDLYPENHLNQVLLFAAFIENIQQHSTNTSETKDLIKSFIQNLADKDDRSARYIHDCLSRTKDLFSRAEMLDLCKKYFHNEEFLTTTSSSHKHLKDLLNAKGSDLIKTEFGEIAPDTTLNDLFYTYRVLQKEKDFKLILKPEVWEEFRTSFSPSSHFYLHQKDALSLSKRFDNPKTPEQNLNLPSMHHLSDHLLCKVPTFKTFTKDEMEQYRFGASETLDTFPIDDSVNKGEVTQEELITQFRELMTSNSPSNSKILNFFRSTLGLEGTINNNNQRSLLDLFRRDKHLLANLFQQDKGLDKFLRAIPSIDHGCFANIGSHIRTAVIEGLITDSCDNKLFSIFYHKVHIPIINQNGVDHPDANSGPGEIFNDSRINELVILPRGLIATLKKEFFTKKDHKYTQVSDPYSLIRELEGDDFSIHLAETLPANHPENYQEVAAEIASYLIIKNTLPDFLETRHLKDFKTKSEKMIDDVKIEVKKIADEEIANSTKEDISHDKIVSDKEADQEEKMKDNRKLLAPISIISSSQLSPQKEQRKR